MKKFTSYTTEKKTRGGNDSTWEDEEHLRIKRQRIALKRQVSYKFGGPSLAGGVCKVFEEKYDLYFVKDSNRWYIYNDTVDTNFHVNVVFKRSLQIEGRGKTKISNEGSLLRAKVIVKPLETVPFLFVQRDDKIPLTIETKKEPITEDYEDTVDVLSVKNEESGIVASGRPKLPPRSFMESVNQHANGKLLYEINKVVELSEKASTEDKLVHTCLKKNIMYVDPNFLPGLSSLAEPTDEHKMQDIYSITWQRPTDYIPKERRKYIKLFRNGIAPQDVDRGNITNCWLSCALSALAEEPYFVQRLFVHPVSKKRLKEEQAVGAHRVSFNKDGWWENVIMDSYLPTVYSQPWFAKCADNQCELWVSLLEKTYAKICGSYVNIIEGDSLMALQDFTGFPVLSFDEVWKKAVENPDELLNFFDDLQRYHNTGFITILRTPGRCTGTYGGAADDPKTEARAGDCGAAGLAPGHAYAVVDVQQFADPDAKLLRIRNPWGTGAEWTGAWSESSGLWDEHPEVRAACAPAERDDGTFWMEWADVVRHFSGGGTCMARVGWHDYRVGGTFRGETPNFVLQMSPKIKMKVVLTLFQSNQRKGDSDEAKTDYDPLLISVYGYSKVKKMHICVANSTTHPEQPTYSTFNFARGRNVGVELVLDPNLAPYIVVPRIRIKEGEENSKSFILGLLAPRKASHDTVEVKFKAIGDNYPPLRNVREFSLCELEKVNLTFERKKPGKVATMRKGTSMHSSSKI